MSTRSTWTAIPLPETLSDPFSKAWIDEYSRLARAADHDDDEDGFAAVWWGDEMKEAKEAKGKKASGMVIDEGLRNWGLEKLGSPIALEAARELYSESSVVNSRETASSFAANIDGWFKKHGAALEGIERDASDFVRVSGVLSRLVARNFIYLDARAVVDVAQKPYRSDIFAMEVALVRFSKVLDDFRPVSDKKVTVNTLAECSDFQTW